jgi:hypothetical protein
MKANLVPLHALQLQHKAAQGVIINKDAQTITKIHGATSSARTRR